ncbi:hypothetical protein [Spiroplasma chrysopicola]|uniref:Uncharacterized protein n=1 Tax=Spiroplasma chrysopicola DF-1 TaxID=1276227 RepID=R4U291_9MOLU|nr:hypothetical protein [Spiroplasma chrysopicola]AGM25472.1 hypothetical protein SCHRY_v1c08990 [Spiroplasma chrysopicola DF-1]
MKHQYFSNELIDLFNSPAQTLELPARVLNVLKTKFKHNSISLFDFNTIQVRHLIQCLYIFTNDVRNVGNKTKLELIKILEQQNLRIFTYQEILEIYNYEYTNNKWFLFNNKEDIKYFEPYKNWRQLIFSPKTLEKIGQNKKN